jgi:hypothetical protein
MATTTPIVPVSDPSQTRSRISAKRLRDISAKVLSEQSSGEDGGVVALTRYNHIYAYVVPAKVAEKALRAREEMASLLRDWKAVTPYIEAALGTGVPIKRVLNEIFKDDSEGSVAIDFAGLARLMSDTPLRLISNEDGTPISRTDFTEFGVVTDAEDDGDFSRFDNL